MDPKLNIPFYKTIKLITKVTYDNIVVYHNIYRNFYTDLSTLRTRIYEEATTLVDNNHRLMCLTSLSVHPTIVFSFNEFYSKPFESMFYLDESLVPYHLVTHHLKDFKLYSAEIL